jgi:hypothetical protein
MEPTAQVILEKIDTIAHELQELRKVVQSQARPPERNLAEQLFGALGQGSWDEYDLHVDWHRFAS